MSLVAHNGHPASRPTPYRASERKERSAISRFRLVANRSLTSFSRASKVGPTY